MKEGSNDSTNSLTNEGEEGDNKEEEIGVDSVSEFYNIEKEESKKS
jgi:hypothetical protein